MLKKVHIKIKYYIFGKHFQKINEKSIKECELYYKFFHVTEKHFSLYFSYSQGTERDRNRDKRSNSNCINRRVYMKKKVLSLVLTAAMMTTMLAGCGSSDNGSQTASTGEAPAAATTEAAASTDAAPAEEVTLKWAIWDQETTQYWGDIKDAYEASHPGVTIEMVDLGSTDYMTVLATELSGSGSDFDVVTIKDVPGYATLVQKGSILSLDDYISNDGVDLSKYAGVTDQVTVDGSLYELPFRNDFWVLFYNKDLFDAKGVAYPTNDMTFDEYDALAREMTDTTFGSQVYGAHYHTWRSAVQLFGVLDGKHTILDGNYDFFKPYYEMVLNQEADGVCRKYTDLKTEGLHYSAAFSGGDVAMMNMGSWFIATMITNLQSGEYDSSLCGNWGIVKYPHAEGVEPGSTLGTITGLAVTTASDTPDASWDFVKWVSGEEGAAVMASSGNFPAVMTDEVVDMIAGLDGFPTDEASKEALTVSNLYLEVPYAPNVSEINSVLDSYHGSIMTGEMSIDDGIAAMNKAVADIQAQ